VQSSAFSQKKPAVLHCSLLHQEPQRDIILYYVTYLPQIRPLPDTVHYKHSL